MKTPSNFEVNCESTAIILVAVIVVAILIAAILRDCGAF